MFENEEVVSYMNEIHENSAERTFIQLWNETNRYPFCETSDVSNL